jgi:hypothetical protein
MNQQAIQMNWKPQAPSNMIEQVVDNELVLLNPDREQVYVLNTLGAAIYDLCDGRTSVQEIIETLENNMKPSEIDLKHETCRFLSHMLEKEVLK